MQHYIDEPSRAERKHGRNMSAQAESIANAKKAKLSPLSDQKVITVPMDDYFTLELSAITANDKISAKEKKRQKALVIEKEKQKKALVSQLRKTPIVQLACERTGVGRSTYYDWRKHDNIFARAADQALEAGRFFINDLAISKLLQMIKDGNITAIIFWLKHNDPKFADVNRIIHQYETVTVRPSVEEENVATQEMSKMLGERLTPKFTTEEIKNQITDGLEESEHDAKSDKRFKSFGDDGSDKKK